VDGLHSEAVWSCTDVTDVVLWVLRGLTALTDLDLHDTSTTHVGRTALNAAIPTLHIAFW
jgi:hypothetical protein